MSNDQHGVIEGKQYQGIDETITWSLTVTNVGSSPTSITVKVYDEQNALNDVTSTVMPTGSPNAVGNVITLPALTALTEGRIYRVETKYTVSGNIVESWFEVQAVR